jgi:hypothetical protein
MSYAGICGSDDLQAHSDPYFHGLSWQQITSYTQSGTADAVATKTTTGNTTPIVSAGGAYTIPARTPFALTAAAFDPDGDAITYDWEQRNGGNPVTVGTDPGVGPIFRSWSPSTKPTRTFPSLPYLLSNLIPFGETLPQTTRSMTFSVVARDNRSGGGGTDMSSTTISVVNTGSVFAVTSPNSAGLSFNGGSNLLVTWNVAGTNANGINCAAVNIKLSLDGGLTYPLTLAGGTANDGFEAVQLPFDTGRDERAASRRGRRQTSSSTWPITTSTS